MIVMINGSFGVGKTTVAERLVSSIANSMLFDPEEVGFMLRNIVPEKTPDFQDLELWRHLTVHVGRLMQETYKKTLIVPMTIYNKTYFQSIYDGFKQFDKQTFHFCLVANENTIYERLRRRGEEEGNWCFQQVEKCTQAFKDEMFRVHIQTDFMDIDDIVNSIAEYILVRQ